MSASPDDPDFLARIMSGINNGLSSPTGLLALSLLNASGPSRMPVSTGQALAQGFGGATGLESQVQQNQMQQLLRERQLSIIRDMQSNPLQPSSGDSAPSVAPAVQPQIQLPPQSLMGHDNPLMSAIQGVTLNKQQNPLLDSIKQGTGGALSATTSNPSSQQPAPIQLPQKLDPYQDTIYLQNQKMARDMDALQPGSGAGYAAAAQQRIDYLEKQHQTLTPEQAKLLVSGGVLPGQSVQYSPATGGWEVSGTEAVKPSQQYDKYGNLISPLIDVRSGKQVGAQSPVASRQPGTPLPGPLESIAQGLAKYTQDLDGINKRGMTGLLIKQRAAEINPAWDETTYPAKRKMAEDLATGPIGQQLRSLNIIQSHLATYQQAMDAVGNGNFQLANKIANAANLQLGSSSVAAVNAVKAAVSKELTKAIGAGVATESDKAEADSILNSYNSPKQTAAVMAQLQSLMGGKLSGLKRNAIASHISDDVFNAYLEPSARTNLDNFEEQQQNMPSQPGLPQGWSVVQH